MCVVSHSILFTIIVGISLYLSLNIIQCSYTDN